MANNESAVWTWKKNVLVNLLTGFPAWLFQIVADAPPSILQSSGLWVQLASEQIRKSWNSQEKKNYTHVVYSYSSPGILEKTRETEQLRELKAVKVRFAHSKFRIVHAQHKQQKRLLFKLALRSLFIISRAHSLLSRAMSHVWPVNTLFQIWLITNCKRN